MSVKTVIPNGGLEMLRAAPNHRLVYTRAACGSGFVAETQLAELTDIVGYVMDLSIVDVKPTETAATLRLQLDNSRAPREFHLYQIGVFAKLMDGDEELISERLLQVAQYDEPDIVRAIPHVSEYVVNTLMGQAETVEGIINLAAYVSIRQFKETIDNLDASKIKQTAIALPEGVDPNVNNALGSLNKKLEQLSKAGGIELSDAETPEPGTRIHLKIVAETTYRPFEPQAEPPSAPVPAMMINENGQPVESAARLEDGTVKSLHIIPEKID